MEQIKKFARYFRQYKWHIVFGILFILVSMAFGLLIPYLVGAAIDDIGGEATWGKIVFYPLAILGVNFVSGIFLFWQRRLLIDASRHIEYDMRRDFYAALVDQPLEFFQNNRVGDLMARATNDLGAIRQIVGPMILYSFQAIFALLIVLPILLNLNVKLTLLMLIPLPFVSLTVKYLGDQVHVRFEKIQEYFSGITARAQENLTGVRVVRAYAQEEAEIAKFQELNREYAAQNLRLVKFAAATRPLLFFFIGLGFVIIVAVGVPMAVRGEITAGTFTAYILYLQRMIWYLIALGYVVNLYQRGTASLKRFNAILETVPTIRNELGAREQSPIKGKIEFKNLTFAYNGKPVLSDVSLKIEPGATVAFVGKTGSGKSTLISLVPRLLDAPAGAVLIDDVPIREYELGQLRRAIGFVPQETFLFSDTLAENIAFGVETGAANGDHPGRAGASPQSLAAANGGKSKAGGKKLNGGEANTGGEADDDGGDGLFEQISVSPGGRALGPMTVEKAAEIAGLAADVEDFPNGYAQLVGERGITLSGGQKQRTAIARAVMRDPRILILDDSLSAVDTYTEEKILGNLRAVRTGRTTLIVSHRISTIRDADVICVLHDGRIIERGTHEELIRLGGEYAALYERQLLEEELEATD